MVLGLTRGLATLVGFAVAGVLIWVSAYTLDLDTNGGYWGMLWLLAAGGLVVGLSQMIPTLRRERPHFSMGTFLFGFIPVLIAAGWVVLTGIPNSGVAETMTDWSQSINIYDGLVEELIAYAPVLAFGIGLALGLCFTTAPARRELDEADRGYVGPVPAERYESYEDRPVDRDLGYARDRARTTHDREPVAVGPETTDVRHAEPTSREGGSVGGPYPDNTPRSVEDSGDGNGRRRGSLFGFFGGSQRDVRREPVSGPDRDYGRNDLEREPVGESGLSTGSYDRTTESDRETVGSGRSRT